MTTQTGNFAELLWPGIAQLWGESYGDWQPMWEKFFTTKTSDRAFEKEQGVTGLGLAGIKNQGSPTSFDDPLQGFQKEYVNVTYGLGAVVTREMFEDDQYNYINGIPKMLARSLRQTEETIAHNHLNNGFSSSFTGADGVSLFNASHPRIGGGTYRNQLSTMADLTQTSLEQALIDLKNYTDDRGLKIMVQPKMLVIPVDNEWNAMRVLKTDKTPGSSDNDINTMRGIMPYVATPYITDTDSWFIVTDVPNGMTFYRRRSAQIERDNEFSTQNLQFLVTERFSSGWTDPRGIYGSQGA